MTRIVTRTQYPAGSAAYPSLRGQARLHHRWRLGHWRLPGGWIPRQGARVAFVDLDPDASAQMLARRSQAQGTAGPWHRQCDVRDVRGLQDAIRDAAAELGDFHVLVNNVANDDRHATLEVTPEYWDQRMAVNQRPAFFAIQAVVPGMQTHGRRLHHQHRLHRLAEQDAAAIRPMPPPSHR